MFLFCNAEYFYINCVYKFFNQFVFNDKQVYNSFFKQ